MALARVRKHLSEPTIRQLNRTCHIEFIDFAHRVGECGCLTSSLICVLAYESLNRPVHCEVLTEALKVWEMPTKRHNAVTPITGNGS